jgi:glycosyltransferase involved in cell wall biosynthesis
MLPLAIVSTHPIQYQVPFFRYLHEHGIPVHAFFLSDRGVTGFDPGFGRDVSWDVPLLEGYPYEFVPNLRREAKPEKVLGLVNPSLFARLSPRRFSAVLVHGYRTISMGGAMFAARARRLPVLYRSESVAWEPLSPQKRRAGAGLDRLVAAFLSIGTRNDAFYEEIGVPARKRFLVPYAVDNERFRAEAERLSKEKARADLGLPADKTLILFLGKLIPIKRPDLLLDAFGRIEDDSVELVFVGDGEMRAVLEERAERIAPGRVTFLGFRNQSEIGGAYRSADLLVLPSTSETWGLVVNEAMNFEVPVVVSDRVGCAADLVQGRDTGAVFREGDVSSLEGTLRSLLADRNELAGMGRTARSVIERWGFAAGEQGVRAALASVGAM